MRRAIAVALLLVLCAASPSADAQSCPCTGMGTQGRRIAMFGDSNTAGAFVTTGVTVPVSSRMTTALAFPHFAANLGVNSDRACVALTERWPRILATGYTHLWLWFGVTDVVNGTKSAAEIFACISQMWDEATAAGIVPIAFTVQGFKGSIFYGAPFATLRTDLNVLIRAGAASRGIALVEADTLLNDPLDMEQLAAAYDSGDHLHVNDAAGALLVSTAITLAHLP